MGCACVGRAIAQPQRERYRPVEEEVKSVCEQGEMRGEGRRACDKGGRRGEGKSVRVGRGGVTGEVVGWEMRVRRGRSTNLRF